MASLLLRTLGLFGLCIAVALVPASSPQASGHAAQAEPPLTDSLYNAHHPRLLFQSTELPVLYNKVRDGGADNDAYAFIRLLTLYIYPGSSMEELLDVSFALGSIPNLGVAAFLEDPVDTAASAIGRRITLHIMNNYGVDTDIFYSSLRLRALALGYDMFFGNTTEAVRDSVRNEMVSYIDFMMTNNNHTIFLYRPYLSNKSSMLASSLGLAAIALDGETDPARVAEALDTANIFISHWLNYQLDPDGAYKEGVIYGAWSMRNLAYYFYARKRFDGMDYSTHHRISQMVQWFAFELLPEGAGRTNNLNDCAWEDFVLSRHNAYADWAQTAWGSQLASWLWDYTAGEYGWDWGMEADKATTALWNQDFPGEDPENTLPDSYLWKSRGLYYYRSGWNFGAGSEDVLFSFYSGEFSGGHAQEDQGQFTLYAYGSKFAIDHGPGSRPKQSEAHNMILIDGRGQHNAGSSIGTDGAIPECLLSGFTDYLFSDQTAAYTTYSKLNKQNYPFFGTDWSWGYDGGNPVNYAYRTVITVHDTLLPPYFLIIDDIEKDGLLPHLYEWRLHTHDANTVTAGANPIQITNGPSAMDVYVLSPPFDSVQTSVTPYQNLTSEPDALVLSVSATEISPTFAFLLFPKNGTVPEPVVSQENQPWGFTLTLDWGGGLRDVFIRNNGGGSVIHPITAAAVMDGGGSSGITYPAASSAKAKDGGDGGRSPGSGNLQKSAAQAGAIVTDAPVAMIRIDNGALSRYLVINATSFSFDDTTWVSSANGPVSCALSGGTINLNRYDCDFTLYGPDVSEVRYWTQNIYFNQAGGYLTPDLTTGVADRPVPAAGIGARAFPNPFNPATTILLDLPARTVIKAAVYDLQGRLIKRLLHRALPPGTSQLEWNGTNDRGSAVSSGVYFLRVESPAAVKTLKLILVK
jgi:hypothetical protein